MDLLAIISSVVQGISSVVIAAFTIALWRATSQQALATKEMRRLQQDLAKAEAFPLIHLTTRSIVEETYGGYKTRGHELEFSNLGKYGCLVLKVSLEINSGGVQELLHSQTPIPLAAGKKTQFQLSEMESLLITQSPQPLQIQLNYFYGGKPGAIFQETYRVEYTGEGWKTTRENVTSSRT